MAAPSAHECTDHPEVGGCGNYWVAPVDAQRLPVCCRHKKFACCRQWQTKGLLVCKFPPGRKRCSRALVANATQVVASLQPGATRASTLNSQLSTLNLPATSPRNSASPSLRPVAVYAILPGHAGPACSSPACVGLLAHGRRFLPFGATPEPSR